LEPVQDLESEADGKPLEVHTPGQKTIEDVARFLGVSPKNKIKTLAYMAEKPSADLSRKATQAVAVFLRGDHSVNETKLAAHFPGGTLRLMTADEIQHYFQSPAGYLGPIGLVARPGKLKGRWFDAGEEIAEKRDLLPMIENPRNINVLVDTALEGRTNLISGANKEDFHLKNVTPGQTFEPTAYADLRSVAAGEACPNCGLPLRIDNAVEIGHIFKLGYKYSASMGARVLDKNGKEVTPIMGCYGIGIERILTAAVEQSNDENGFWLPRSIAPFEIVVSPTNVKDENLLHTAIDIATRLESAGFDVLLDDRDERPGVKFKDADLVGIPFRVTVGKKVTEGTVEVVQRSTREVEDASIREITQYFHRALPPGAG
jgi:prolyl-tRNA synthetase